MDTLLPPEILVYIATYMDFFTKIVYVRALELDEFFLDESVLSHILIAILGLQYSVDKNMCRMTVYSSSANEFIRMMDEIINILYYYDIWAEISYIPGDIFYRFKFDSEEAGIIIFPYREEKTHRKRNFKHAKKLISHSENRLNTFLLYLLNPGKWTPYTRDNSYYKKIIDWTRNHPYSSSIKN